MQESLGLLTPLVETGPTQLPASSSEFLLGLLHEAAPPPGSVLLWCISEASTGWVEAPLFHALPLPPPPVSDGAARVVLPRANGLILRTEPHLRSPPPFSSPIGAALLGEG